MEPHSLQLLPGNQSGLGKTILQLVYVGSTDKIRSLRGIKALMN